MLCVFISVFLGFFSNVSKRNTPFYFSSGLSDEPSKLVGRPVMNLSTGPSALAPDRSIELWVGINRAVNLIWIIGKSDRMS